MFQGNGCARNKRQTKSLEGTVTIQVLRDKTIIHHSKKYVENIEVFTNVLISMNWVQQSSEIQRRILSMKTNPRGGMQPRSS